MEEIKIFNRAVTKETVKKAAIATAATGLGAQYLAASVIDDFSLFKNYKFSEYMDSFNYNLAHPISTVLNVLSNDLFHQAQPFLLLGTLYIGGKVLLPKVYKYEDASDVGSHGTARFAKDPEIFNKDIITTDLDEEGHIVGMHKGKTLIRKDPSECHLNANTAVIGGSGAGKTQSNIIPNILKTNTKSMVVIDVKGELYEKTSEFKRQQGYEVHLVNFKNRDISDRYNLFDYIRRDADAYKIATTLVENVGDTKPKMDFWNLSQISLLQALMLYVKYKLPKEMQHMGSVYALSQVSSDEIRKLFMEFPEGHIVRKAYMSAMDKLQDKTEADVFSTLNQTLNPWQYRDVCEFTNANDFLFEDLGSKKMIVYVMIPIADNEFKPLITTFFTQMFSELYRLADKNLGELPTPVMLLLDEFANIGKLSNFESRISTTRSLKIEVTLVLQDTSQLEKVYGKESAREIMSNCDTTILLKASEPASAKYFSQRAGKTTIKMVNKSKSSGSKSNSTTESDTYMGRDLITPDEVERLNRNYELLFIVGERPMKIKKPWTNKIKAFKGLQRQQVSRDKYPVPNRGRYFEFSEDMLYDEVLTIPFENGDEEITVNPETGEIVDQQPQGPEESVIQAKFFNDPEENKTPPKPKKIEQEPEDEYPSEEELLKVKKEVDASKPERFNFNDIYEPEEKEEETKESPEDFTF
ncbi:VirD4-like conjugal transfer protein, CD1115 family [Priestia megaterium]|uniref:VirD4-like conjugal transfer protein, CD1115 family n=1 Tax=Priestia megaterium TaxID=1404 RepID=UPI000BFC4490|nr:type IV secretory system conjugative DNA transfer family protein [Priestia megaterium]PGQ88333.1 hypothetical protein COA18_05230 [Priestia megaterium]